jgi:hypothetical protein
LLVGQLLVHGLEQNILVEEYPAFENNCKSVNPDQTDENARCGHFARENCILLSDRFV